MKFRETPDLRFENLPDYDFAPNYVAVDDDEGGMLNMHYIEVGPTAQKKALCSAPAR